MISVQFAIFKNWLSMYASFKIHLHSGILEWLQKQKNEFTMEVVTGKILANLVEDQEFVAVFYAGQNGCNSDDEACQDILEGLEEIDDELDAIGIAFVQTRDEDYPYNQHGISYFPALGLLFHYHIMVSIPLSS